MQAFAALGSQGSVMPEVQVIPSSALSKDEVRRLVAITRAVTYPSFHESFGLPVVESLAYGRPLRAQRCALWTESAALACLPGRLVEFDSPASLIEALDGVQAPTGWRMAPSTTEDNP